MKIFRLLSRLSLVPLLLMILPSSAYAQTSIYKTLETPFYDPNGGTLASSCSGNIGGNSTAQSNLDYAGRPILNQGQLQAVAQNQPTYQQAAQQAGIPWQILAAVHYRETGLSLTAPSNGDGQYQIVKKTYPSSGTITQQEFLQESIDAANFIKSDGAGLDTNPSVATIKNAFYFYNGRGEPLYPNQSAALGFDSKTQAYEGSPYVMNVADARRDPSVAPTGSWLQYGTGANGAIGPASGQYGAYLIYADLTGTTLNSGDCSLGSVNCSNNTGNQADSASSVRQKIVCVAEGELALWNAGKLTAGHDFFKYSEGRDELWCADFVSWVYNQAGYSFGPQDSITNNWNISYVGNLIVPPQSKSKFTYHTTPNYKPQPGDLAIHSTPDNQFYHVNLVDSTSSGKIILIGGDQHGGGSADSNVVNTETISSPFDDNIIGYVGPN